MTTQRHCRSAGAALGQMGGFRPFHTANPLAPLSRSNSPGMSAGATRLLRSMSACAFVNARCGDSIGPIFYRTVAADAEAPAQVIVELQRHSMFGLDDVVGAEL